MNTLEDYGTRPVPASKSKNWLEIGLILWGINICIPAFLLGGFLSTYASFPTVIAAIIAGSAILTLLGLATGILGTHTRMSTSMSAQFTFGKTGALLPSLIFAVATFGWFGMQLEVFGASFVQALTRTDSSIFIVGGGLLMIASALLGLEGISRLSNWVVPLLVVLLLGTFLQTAANPHAAPVFEKSPINPKSFGTLLSAIVGALAAGAVIMPDVTRFGKNKSHTAWGVFFGTFVGFPLILLVSAYLGAATGKADFTLLLLDSPQLLWKCFALFAILFATWTTNDNNLYSSALALNSLFPRVPKWALTILGGGLGIALALMGMIERFIPWMVCLSVIIPPIGAVMAADFFLFRKNYDPKNLNSIPQFRWEALIACLAGMGAGSLTSFHFFSATEIPALDGVIVALGIYFSLRVLKKFP